MNKLHKIAEQLVNLTVKESKEIQIILEENYGIKPTESIETIQIIPKEKVQVQTEFDVILLEVSHSSRIKTVKLIKELINSGLIEAKRLIDNVPSIVFENINKEEAESYAQQLRELDCIIEIK